MGLSQSFRKLSTPDWVLSLILDLVVYLTVELTASLLLFFSTDQMVYAMTMVMQKFEERGCLVLELKMSEGYVQRPASEEQ